MVNITVNIETELALTAAKDGNIPTLSTLFRSEPYAVDGFGASTLHYATRSGQLECARWLVEAIGISPNVKADSGATPVHDAAALGQLQCVKYLLGRGGVDTDTRDNSGHTALHLAARFGRFETVKWLLEEGKCNARAKTRNYMTPIHFAASGGHLTCLELLVFKAGYSSVNDLAADGTTPLYLAAQDGNLDCLRYLHSVGGKCDMHTHDGMLPIHGAAQNGHLDCVGYLIETGQATVCEKDITGGTPAHYAASQGHVTVLKWLNAKGDIASVDKLGGTPLHDAAEQGQVECVRYLVETAQLDVNQADNEGFSAAALAEKNGHRKCVDYLKIAGSKQAKAQTRKEKAKQSLARADRSELSSESKPLMLDKGSLKNAFCWKPSIQCASTSHSQSDGLAKNLSTMVHGERKNHDGKINKPVLSNSPPDLANSITQTSQSRLSRVTSVEALRGLQLQPVPHFGEIVPPPAQFRDTSDNSKNRHEEPLLLDREVVIVNVNSPVTELFKNDNVDGNAWLAADSIELTDTRDKSTGNIQTSKDDWNFKNQQNRGRLDHVAVVEGRHSSANNRNSLERVPKQGDQSAIKEGWSELPPWKRQDFVSRMVKERDKQKMEQDMREIERRKWTGVPKWKIPLLAKREEKRLREEQRWNGVPDWKKNLIRRRESIRNGDLSLLSTSGAENEN